MKILVVEDSATLRFALDNYIRAAGHETVIAENGEKAVQIIEHTPIDMIIMDVEMPGLNGFETTRLIRESLGEHWIPIIFLTGKSEEESLEQGIAVGGDDYLIKPVSKVILHAKIKAMERIARMRTQLHELNTRLVKLSQRDGLTQLYNRRTFEEKAQEAWRLATRNKEPLTILLFDIDHFKLYNDNYGHPAGDSCIQRVASALDQCFNRPGDIVARYGGEEFVVLLPNTDSKGAEHVAEIMRKQIELLGIEHQGSPGFQRVTVSIGGCTLRFTTGASLDKQLELADRALYQSKKSGRNRATLNQYNDLHSVVLIDADFASCAHTVELLKGHCELYTIQNENDIKHFDVSGEAELIVTHIQEAGDDSIRLYQKLCQTQRVGGVPHLLYSSLSDAFLEGLQRDLHAECVVPSDQGDQLIARINHCLKSP